MALGVKEGVCERNSTRKSRHGIALSIVSRPFVDYLKDTAAGLTAQG